MSHVHSPTFVLIPGSNSNSFGWAPLQRELALLGHRSLAVDLPGHGFDAALPAAYQYYICRSRGNGSPRRR